MAIGTVKWFDTGRGFGFLEPSTGGKDVFVHITALQTAGLTGLREGQTVNYELEQDRRGRMAAGQLRVV